MTEERPSGDVAGEAVGVTKQGSRLVRWTASTGHFPNDDAAIKLLWLAIRDIEDKRTRARARERGRSIGSSCIDLFPGVSPPACGRAAVRRRGQGSTRRVDRAAAAGPSRVGPILAAVFVAEIGDITRFRRPAQLACWAGLTPNHHESDTTVHRGRITKQGSRLVRWAAVEAVQRVPAHTRLGQPRDRIAAPPRPQHRRRRRRP